MEEEAVSVAVGKSLSLSGKIGLSLKDAKINLFDDKGKNVLTIGFSFSRPTIMQFGNHKFQLKTLHPGDYFNFSVNHIDDWNGKFFLLFYNGTPQHEFKVSSPGTTVTKIQYSSGIQNFSAMTF